METIFNFSLFVFSLFVSRFTLRALPPSQGSDSCLYVSLKRGCFYAPVHRVVLFLKLRCTFISVSLRYMVL